MSGGFQAIQWNRQKLVYDGDLLAGIALYVGLFMLWGWWSGPPDRAPDWEDLRIGAFGSGAFLMMTLVLAIGPLARLDRGFLPLLYNRRHFGVLTFAVAALHGWFIVDWYRVRGNLPNLAATLTDWPRLTSFPHFPFEMLGVAALVIMLVMAVTSHDFWLGFLGPPVWKALHMALYGAYGLAAMHIALGIMQDNRRLLIPILLGGGVAVVAMLHLAAGWRERATDRGTPPQPDGWLVVGPPESIRDKQARIVAAPGGERIAVFRDGARIGALTNLCAHQNGPLGEGRIIDGCVTCPWHGYQYRLEDGCAPPPYEDKLATYRLRIRNGVIEVDPNPLPPGTPAALILS